MLTERELAVLKLRQEGKTQAEIAQMLSISQPAVSSFERNGQRKIVQAQELLENLKKLGLLALLLLFMPLLAGQASATQYITPSNSANQSIGVGNLLFLDNTNGRIGINTISPNATIHIVGTGNFSSTLFVGGVITGAAGLTIQSGSVSLPSGTISNVELANSSVTVNSGNGLSGGGSLALGGTLTLSTSALISGAGNYSYWNGSAWLTRADLNNAYTAGNGLNLSGSSVFAINATTCSAGQYSYWNGTAWLCATDNTGSGGNITGNGSANYIGKWANGTHIATGLLYDNGSGIGVGTIAPQEALSVAGNIYLNDSYILNTTSLKEVSTLGEVLYLPFEDQSTSLTKDWSGRNKDGTVSGATPVTGGYVGGAYQLNGVNNYIDISSSDFNFASKNFTLSLWVNSSGYNNQGSAWNCLIARDNPFNATGYGLCIDSTNATYFYAGNVGINSGVVIKGGWHHVVGVHDTTASTLKIYVDGLLKSTSSTYSNNLTSVSNTLMAIGRDSGGVRYANETVDEVRIYNRTLSASEVKTLYQMGVNAKQEIGGSWVSRDYVYVDNNSRVGINTTAPNSTLHVVGTENVSSTLFAGSTITGASGLTIQSGSVSLPSGSISNVELANSSVTVSNGTGLSGGGSVALGGSTTLSLANTAVVVGSYGNASAVGNFTVDAQGRITGASTTAIALNAAAITSGALGVARGGTGAATFPSNGVLLGNAATNVTATVAGAADTVLRVPTAGGAPAFGAINLSSGSAVTNKLGVANGGTGAATFPTGYVVLGNAATNLTTDTTLFYDTANNRLGINNTAPNSTLHVVGTANITGAVTVPNSICSAGQVLSTTAAGTLQCVTDNTGLGGNVTGDGIANYVAHFVNATYVTTGLLYDNGSGVGIGTTSPATQLDVVGNFSTSGFWRNGVGGPSGANLIPISADAWRNNTNMWLRLSGATASITITNPPAGALPVPTGKVHEFTNISSNTSTTLVIDQLIPINTNLTYYGRVWVDRINGTGTLYAGYVAYDQNLTQLAGNGGTYGYFIASAQTPSATGTWYYGKISGNGSATNQFPNNTAYIKPLIIVNYNVGGTMDVAGFEISDRPFEQYNGVYDLATQGTSRVYINSAGNVGVGNTAPNSTLHVVGTENVSSTLFAGSTITGASGLTIQSGTVSLPSGSVQNVALGNSSLTVTAGNGLNTTGSSISLGGSATIAINATTCSGGQYSTWNGTAWLCAADNITGSGVAATIPIWTTTSALGNSPLTYSGVGEVILAGNASNYSGLAITGGGSAATNSGANLRFEIGAITNRTGYIRYNDGSGTQFAGQALDMVIMNEYNTSNLGGILFGTFNTSRMYIKYDGTVGINNTSPGATLDVTGNGRFSNGLTVTAGTVALPSGSVQNVALGNSSLTVSAGNGLNTTGSSISLGGSATIAINATTCSAGQYSTWNGTAWLCATDNTGSGGNITGNGIANYAGRWTNGTNLGTGLLYDNTSAVGIGNTAPNATLHVSGTANITSTLFVGGAITGAAGLSVPSGTVTASSFSGAGTGLTGTAASLTVGNSNQLDGNASTYYAPVGSPTFTGTVTIPSPFVLGGVSTNVTGTILNRLNQTSGTTGTATTNIVFSTSPTIATPVIANIRGGTVASSTLTLRSTSSVAGPYTDAMIFQTGNSTERMRIDANGNVGVGAVAPWGDFHINGTDQILVLTSTSTVGNNSDNVGVELRPANASAVTYIDFAPNSTNISTPDYGGRIIYYGNVSTTQAGSFNFLVNGGTNALMINNTGNIGIGTTSPTVKLDVAGIGNFYTAAGNSYVGINGDAGQYSFLRLSQGGASQWDLAQISTSSSPNALQFRAGGSNPNVVFEKDNPSTPTLYVQTGGNVGIGESSPGYKLDVAGNMRINGSVNPRLYLSSNSGTVSPRAMDISGNNWRFYREGGPEGTLELFHLQASGIVDIPGSLGIGNTAPNATLHVTGTGNFTSTLFAGSTITGASGLTIQSGSVTLPTGSIAGTYLANTAVAAGSYGNASAVGNFTVDAQGRITGATTTAIALDASAITSGKLGVARGGTNAATFPSNGVLIGNAATNITATAAGAANTVLRVPNAGGAPAFGAINLSSGSAVTSTLSVANGGTGLGASVEDAVLVGSGTSTWQTQTLPSCSGATSKLLYDTGSNTFSCGTDAYTSQTTASQVIAASGWYRVANITGASGRGQFTYTLFTTGGSWSPRSTTIRMFKDYDVNAGLTVLSEFGGGYWNESRVTNDTSNSYLELYFTQAVNVTAVMDLDSNVMIATPVLYSGTLPTNSSSEQVLANAVLGGLLNVGSNKLVVDSSGNVGIEATSPIAKLDLGTNNAMFLGGNSNTWGWYLNVTDSGGGNVPLMFIERNAGTNTERMRIAQGGNIGIGTTSPLFALDVHGYAGVNASSDQFRIGDSSNNHTWRIGTNTGTGTDHSTLSIYSESHGGAAMMAFNESSGNVVVTVG